MQTGFLYSAIGGFGIGVAIYGLYAPAWIGIFFVLFVGCVLVLLHGIRFWTTTQYATLFAGVFCIACSLGMVRYGLSVDTQRTTPLDALLQQHVVVEGIVARDPDRRENSVRTVITVDTVHMGTTSQPIDPTRIITSVPRYPVVSYGDRLEVSGVLQRPESFVTDTGRVFNYVEFLAKDSIWYEMKFPDITILSSGNGGPIRTGLFTLKRWFLGKIQHTMHEPHASIVGGVLLGTQEGLRADLTDTFRKTGLIHMLVLSGYNIALMSEFAQTALSFLPVWGAWLGTSIVMVLFVVMTGASATGVRALIMAMLVILAKVLGRRYDAGRALVIAGVGMVLHNPRILLFDPSFQLSFLATLGLIYMSPIVERWCARIPKRYGFREIIVTTIATQLLVTPVLLFQNGMFSLVSLPANILVLPVVPLIMLFGFGTGVVGIVSTLLAFPFGLMTEVMTRYMLFVSQVLSTIPVLIIGVFHGSLLIVYYTVMLIWMYRHHQTNRPAV